MKLLIGCVNLHKSQFLAAKQEMIIFSMGKVMISIN